MNDFQILRITSSKRYRVQPMRGAKQIDRDVRQGVGGGRGATGGLTPQFPGLGAPSYR